MRQPFKLSDLFENTFCFDVLLEIFLIWNVSKRSEFWGEIHIKCGEEVQEEGISRPEREFVGLSTNWLEKDVLQVFYKRLN